MWICVFNETDTRFWLCQDTGAMNRPLRLTDCSPRISWVYVGISRIVCWHFVECSPRNWQIVRSRRGPIYRARIYENTHKMGDENACVVK